jgi:hypothetical protein
LAAVAGAPDRRRLAMFGSFASYLRRHHIGMLALFIALSGTAYAATLPRNSVGTAQLKKNAVTTAKVKNRSLLAKDFKSGQLPAGPRGPQGAQGAQGAPGAAGATNVSVRVGPEVSGLSTASCNPGERAVGGGGTATGANGALWDSGPTQPSGTPTSWDAQAIDVTTAAVDDPVLAYVICAAP